MSTDINILLLGQIGAGKTTFINAFSNYLVHHSLDDAIQGEFQVPIPASFSYMDSETFEERIIQIGISHECEQTGNVGSSCTRECRSFVFRINNKNLRLIDTPGIGDTEGVTQDDKNFENILAYISQYEHLNGIYILLKPNEYRLTILFRFCLKELLRHLHVDAKENIMFVFTNSRATSFLPGRSVPVLRQLLNSLQSDTKIAIPFSKENTFLLENEAFRFLAMCKNGIKVSAQERSDYAKSWSHTINEFERLISKTVQCKKHATRDTVSLNEAQQLIRKLSRPIGEITTVIQKNIQLVDVYKKSMTSNSSSQSTVLEQVNIEIVELQYPRTVCTNDSCTKMIIVNGIEQIDYATHCHAHCYLSGVEEDLIGDEKLKSCSAINQSSGRCVICNCDWKKHMYITYELRKTISKITVGDKVVVDQHLQSLKSEQEAILRVCGQLAHFIRTNSMNPVNDDILEYIQHFIREEKQKKYQGAKNDDIIVELEKLEDDYRKEMEVIKQLMNGAQNQSSTTSSTITPQKIFDLVRDLYHLPLYGKKIREQVEQVKIVQQKARQDRETLMRSLKTAETSPTMVGLRKILV